MSASTWTVLPPRISTVGLFRPASVTALKAACWLTPRSEHLQVDPPLKSMP